MGPCRIAATRKGHKMLDTAAVRETFNRVAARYDRHAALEQEVGKRLLERCGHARREPRCILDLGCGTGKAGAELKKMYRRARVIGVDSAVGMLAHVRRRTSLLRPVRAVCADLSALPFAHGSADLLFSNLAAPWHAEPDVLFAEFRRILRPGGMLLISTLGPATLRELRDVSAGLADARRSPGFPDLMVVGDALVAGGFNEPVMDMEVLTVQYPSLEALTVELDSTGMSLLVPGWEHLLERRVALEAALSPGPAGKYSVSYEIIYGTAFGPEEGQPIRTPEGDMAAISVESLLKSRRMR